MYFGGDFTHRRVEIINDLLLIDLDRVVHLIDLGLGVHLNAFGMSPVQPTYVPWIALIKNFILIRSNNLNKWPEMKSQKTIFNSNQWQI